MRKSEIEKLAEHTRDRAEARPAKRGAPDARERPYKRTDGAAVNLSSEAVCAIAEAVAAAVVARLEELLPICARVAAADTMRSMQQPETVLRKAVDEGLIAAGIIRERRKS